MAHDYGRGPSVIYSSDMATYWENQLYSGSPTMTPADGGDIRLSQVQVRFKRTEDTGVREDIELFSLYMFVDAGIATPVSALNASQSATVEGFLNTWWTSVASYYTPHINIDSYVWRDWSAAGPISTKTGFVMPQPIRRLTSHVAAGTASPPPTIDQCAIDTTFVTASRKHWGRVYCPSPKYNALTSLSRWDTSVCDAFATAFDVLFNAMGTNATVIVPCVWSPKYRGLLTLTAVKTDDVPDVIRSRRPKQKTYEKRWDNTH